MDYTQQPIRHLSVCSGYEGLGLGIRRIFPSIREIAFVEGESWAVANLANKMEEGKLHPAPVWTDVKTFPFRQFRGKVDILSGGFPCQPFSTAGSGKGVSDERHLYPFISAGIRECQPTVVFLENVPGIITKKLPDGTPVLQHVLQDLEGMGYTAEAGIFSAEETGAPHRRDRVFILAYAKGKREVSGGWGCEGVSGSGVQTTNPSVRQGREASSEGSVNIRHNANDSNTSPELADTQSSGRTKREPTTQGSGSQAHRPSQRRSQAGELDDTHAGHIREIQELRTGGNSTIQAGQEGELDDTRSTQPHRISGERGQAYPSAGSAGQSGELADADNSRGREDREPSQLRTDGTQQSPSHPGGDREGEDVEEPGRGWEINKARWPARPGHEQHEWEEPRTTQPQLGGTVDGDTSGVDPTLHRMDRLRMIGNGVVPEQGAQAYQVLAGRLIGVDA